MYDLSKKRWEGNLFKTLEDIVHNNENSSFQREPILYWGEEHSDVTNWEVNKSPSVDGEGKWATLLWYKPHNLHISLSYKKQR